MLGFRVGVRVSVRVRVRVRFPPIKNRSTYVGSLKLCGISDNACRLDAPQAYSSSFAAAIIYLLIVQQHSHTSRMQRAKIIVINTK